MWIDPNTQQVFNLHSDIRGAFPNVSFPTLMTAQDISAVGLEPVAQTLCPDFDPITHALVELPPAQVDGVWTQQWQVQSLSPEQSAANLAAAKAAKNEAINAARLAANRTTFTHGGKVFACDELSRGDIDGINGFVALNSAMPPGWPGGWKAVDNTYLPVPDVDAWKAFYGSMVAAGNANFAHAQTLKAALAEATTTAEINAIVW